MKTTVTYTELVGFRACSSGLERFVEAHGKKKGALLSEAYKSNGWGDFWWYVGAAQSRFSKSQIDDLVLLAADYAESALPHYQSYAPDDSRVADCIKAIRDFVRGKITRWELDDAAYAARAAASAAASLAAYAAARSAARSAARVIGGAADDAADDAAAYAAYADYAGAGAGAAASAARERQEKQLLDLLLKWERCR